MDKIDELIIAALSRDSRQGVGEIWDHLRGLGHSVPEEEIEARRRALEGDGVIRYTVSVDAKKLPAGRRVVRVDLVTFRTSQALPRRLEGLKKYLADAPFVVYSGRTRGGYDWITVKAFLTAEMADEENDIYRNLFGDILQVYEVYDFVPQTPVSTYALVYTEAEYKAFLKEWVPPFIGR